MQEIQGYINVGSRKSTNFSPKDCPRISCSHRSGSSYVYLWLTKDVKWEYVLPRIKADFSEVRLDRTHKDAEDAVRVRPPQGTRNYPGLHIRPDDQGLEIEPFDLVETTILSMTKDVLRISIPKSIRHQFSKTR